MIVPRAASVNPAVVYGSATSIAPESWDPPGPLPSWLIRLWVHDSRAVVQVCAWCLPSSVRNDLDGLCPPDGPTTLSHGLCRSCDAPEPLHILAALASPYAWPLGGGR